MILPFNQSNMNYYIYLILTNYLTLLNNQLLIVLVAVFAVNINNGLFVADGGYEYALVLMVAFIALAIQGGGYLSMDNALSEQLDHV